jgi:hypothetical protein
VVSAARWVSVAALSVAGCASIWGFEDLRSGDGGTGGASSSPGLTGGRSAGGQTSNAGATGTGGAVLACQRNCVAPCTDCPASYCTDLDSDPKNCGNCGSLCLGGRICSGGKCECAPDFVICQGADLLDACFDPLTDPKHCGDCETACDSDGLCVDGTCEYPQDLATDQGNPRALTLDSSYVYYSTDTEIRKVPLEGGVKPTTLAAAGIVPEIVVDGDSLYYVDTTAKRLLRLPLDGGETLELAEAIAPVSLAVYGGEVYFLQGPSIFAVPIDGGTRRSVGNNAAEAALGVVVNDDGVYVSYYGSFMLYSHNGANVTTFAVRTRDTAMVRDFSLYGGTLYYTTGNSLMSIKAGATYGTTLSSDYAYLLAVDRDEIVYTGSGDLRALPTTNAGSEPRVLSADAAIVNLAVLDDYVYWTRHATATDRDDGKIRRIRR